MDVQRPVERFVECPDGGTIVQVSQLKCIEIRVTYCKLQMLKHTRLLNKPYKTLYIPDRPDVVQRACDLKGSMIPELGLLGCPCRIS